VRAAICAAANSQGGPARHAQLAAIDPATAASLHPNHSQRIQRALEIYRLTGVAPSQLKQAGGQGAIKGIADDYEIIQIALLPKNRALLHGRIGERFEKMLELGLLEEVERLRSRGDLHKDLPAIRAVGYRQVWEYLDGELSCDDMVAKAIAATRQLAKRQMTWLRGWPSLQEIFIDNGGDQFLPPEIILEQVLKLLQNSTIYNSVNQ
jgi:tRNA dimethylallyltransferase